MVALLLFGVTLRVTKTATGDLPAGTLCRDAALAYVLWAHHPPAIAPGATSFVGSDPGRCGDAGRGLFFFAATMRAKCYIPLLGSVGYLMQGSRGIGRLVLSDGTAESVEYEVLVGQAGPGGRGIRGYISHCHATSRAASTQELATLIFSNGKAGTLRISGIPDPSLSWYEVQFDSLPE
jgi:hypothetical protein